MDNTETQSPISTNRSPARPTRPKAFGVDKTRPERYSLRQARYQALAETISQLAQQFQQTGRRLRLLDVGLHDGLTMRYLEVLPGADNIDYHGVDLEQCPTLYRPQTWQLSFGDLSHGLPMLASDSFDVVICEQVLEHIHDVDLAASTLTRVLAPGGLLIVGVPSFPEGIHLLRKHFVPILDRVFPPNKVRSHVQAFSKRTFLRLLRRNGADRIHCTRGFRIISGGLLRGLENHKWWWQLNRWIGAVVPSLCIEIQVVATKERPSAAASVPTNVVPLSRAA